MAGKEDLATGQLLTRMNYHKTLWNDFFTEVATRAQLQQYTEQQYNALAQLAEEAIALMGTLRVEQIVDVEWIVKRDAILQRTQRFFVDTPIGESCECLPGQSLRSPW